MFKHLWTPSYEWLLGEWRLNLIILGVICILVSLFLGWVIKSMYKDCKK